MSTSAFCPWCDQHHLRNAPCPCPTINPQISSPVSVPASIRQRAPLLLHPNAPVAAAVPTPALNTTSAALNRPASKQRMPATAVRPALPPTQPNPPVAGAKPAPTNTNTGPDQPPSATQAEPDASPSQPRSLKRKEAPGAYEHYTITDHDNPTQREQRNEKYKADLTRRYREKKQRQAGQEGEEQTGQGEDGEDHEDVASGIAEGEKGVEILRGPISVVFQRLIHTMAAWREKAGRLQAEKEVLMGLLEEEAKKNEELELWRRNTMEPF